MVTVAELEQRLRQLDRDFSTKSPSGGGGEVVLRNSLSHSQQLIHCNELTEEAIDLIVQHFTPQNHIQYWFSLLMSSLVIRSAWFEALKEQYSETSKTTSAKLLSQLMTLLQEVCTNLLSSDLTKVCDEKMALTECSAFAMKNQRRKMEDRHVCVPNLKLLYPEQSDDISFFAVFDGHRGAECANYASAHLLGNLVKSEHFKTDLRQAICDGYADFDSELTEKCRTESVQSGCTCCCALLTPSSLMVSWVGDSQALLIKNGCPEQITCPHNVTNDAECKRIESLGGMIIDVHGQRRVSGVLAVTRSFGDISLRPLLCAEPEIAEIELTGGEEVLIIASDGVWDVLSSDDAAQIVRKCCQTLEDGSGCASEIVQASKNNGSQDNLTCIVVFIKSWERLRNIYAT